MKILIVEDEIKAADFLKKGFIENGFTVETAHTGNDGLHLAQTNRFDLIILDISLPERDGLSVVSELRKQGDSTMVLFLTAKDSIEDRVKGLNMGGDSYLVKPFAFAELLALVKSLLRRSRVPRVEILKLDDLEIDLLQHKVLRAGKRIDLTPKEFSLLALLARNSGEIVSRSHIADQVWGMSFESETNVVDVHIGRLRNKIDLPFSKKLIHTIRGMGYVLRCDLDHL
jgi:two-component system copper resistance phosphate regulon response regulator CusR